jgi:hypothetical protein
MRDTITDALEPDLEPRGPHLPDAITRVPYGTWLFGLLALWRLIWFVRETELGPAPAPSVILAYVGGLVPAVVAVLLPAILLLRHPDAWSSARTLLLGTVLFAVVEGMRVLGPALQPVFESATPGSEETPYLIPLALLYSSAQGLLATFAVANVGLGLAQARRYLDRRGTLAIALVAGLVVVVASAARLITVSRLPFDEIPMTPTVAIYLSSAIVLGVLSVMAWGYLAATSTRGARAGEEPGRGWALGALGAWLILSAFAIAAVAALAEPTPETQDSFTALMQAISLIHTLGYLGLLGSLLVGLPSLDALDDDIDAGYGEEPVEIETGDDIDQPVDDIDLPAGDVDAAAR